MIISIEELKKYNEFANKSDEELTIMQDSIEELIRKYTNNNFQNRNIRFVGSSKNGSLEQSITYLKVGDTIQISNSTYNNGLYVIKSIEDTITLDKTLYDDNNFTVTKIEYPTSIKMGVLNILKWEVSNRKKVGIQSETLSRHSVTYFNQDGNNQLLGYPVSLLGFLQPYMKARF